MAEPRPKRRASKHPAAPKHTSVQPDYWDGLPGLECWPAEVGSHSTQGSSESSLVDGSEAEEGKTTVIFNEPRKSLVTISLQSADYVKIVKSNRCAIRVQ